MFYKVKLEKLVTVPPDRLDGTLQRHLESFLREAVEGQLVPLTAVVGGRSDIRSALKSSATILAVIDILSAQNLQGKVLDNGCVSFLLQYDALVLKMHRGEVFDAQVEKVAPEGWWGRVFGVGKVFVSRTQMSSDLSHPEWEYESGVAEGSWLSMDGTKSVKVNDIVRLRVLGETPQSSNALMIGTMVGDYLGPL